jgi:SAM-dependent methyltransferase
MKYDPDASEKLRIVTNNYRMFGLWQTLKDFAVYLLSEPPADDFDKRYQVKTSGSVKAQNAGIEDEVARRNAIKYVPIPANVMRGVLARITREIDASKTIFIDLGCGKGRALFIAGEFGFERVEGVEISPAHTAIAQENIERFLERRPKLRGRIRAVCDNATTFAYPDAPLLIYMYRPFVGPVFEAAMENIVRFRDRSGHSVRLAFVCPDEEFMLEAHPRFRKVYDCQVISEEYSWTCWECSAPN